KHPDAKPIKDWSLEFPFLTDKPAMVSLEGYLFPDTYRFAMNATAEDIVRRLLREFDRKFTMELRAEAADQKRSIFEVVVLASLLEREVQSDSDKAKVADLFLRRLDAKWALQADSTVNYATGGTSPSISLEETRFDSPYNTYLYRGLPIGPISNPGLASLRAALHPEKNEYWFFLTTPTGEVRYGRNLDEHNANRRFLK
ncbi:MAG: endolytic transglycosylase MltG, partial [bacterium]